MVSRPDHPGAYPGGRIYEHILVASDVLGKLLPPGAVVHHINEDRSDNRHSNLVICQDDAYHKLLHKRMRERMRRLTEVPGGALDLELAAEERR